MVHILNDMIGACYQLNFLVKGENKGRTRYITKQAAGKMYQTHGSSWPKCAHAEENVAGVEMTLSHVGWTQTNCSLCQMLRHVYLPVLCSAYHTVQSWAEVSKETPCATTR